MSTTLLVAENIHRRYGERAVLENVTLRVDAGSRIGLVGPNGSGKTTLLRILGGLERPDTGWVRAAGTVGYLSATPDSARTGREAILAAVGLTAASGELDRWAGRLQAGDLDAIAAHASALERWLALGGPDADGRLAAVAEQLGLEPDLTRPVAALSGGQAARVRLAAIAMARHDVMLLDEPANHLDADGLTRPRCLMDAHSGGTVLVAHDRQLLADTCTETVALERHTGEATSYPGGYARYERERDAARARALAAHERALAQREELNAAEREMRRRAQASLNRPRTRHDNDKNSHQYLLTCAQPASCSTSRPTTLTSSPSRYSRRPSRTGPERSSSPATTPGSARAWPQTAS